MGLSRIAHLPSNLFLTVVPGDSVKISGDRVNISLPSMNVFEDLIAEKAGIVKAEISLNTVRRKRQEHYNVLAMEEIDDIDH